MGNDPRRLYGDSPFDEYCPVCGHPAVAVRDEAERIEVPIIGTYEVRYQPARAQRTFTCAQGHDFHPGDMPAPQPASYYDGSFDLDENENEAWLDAELEEVMAV